MTPQPQQEGWEKEKLFDIGSLFFDWRLKNGLTLEDGMRKIEQGFDSPISTLLTSATREARKEELEWVLAQERLIGEVGDSKNAELRLKIREKLAIKALAQLKGKEPKL